MPNVEWSPKNLAHRAEGGSVSGERPDNIWKDFKVDANRKNAKSRFEEYFAFGKTCISYY